MMIMPVMINVAASNGVGDITAVVILTDPRL